MLRHMFIIPLMALSIAGAADTACAMNTGRAAANRGNPVKPSKPQYRGRLQDVAKNDLNKTTDYPGCMSKERTARDQFRKSGLRTRPTCMSNACIS